MCELQGPPGTGKTRTLLALLEVLARIARAPGRADAMGPILACADTNAATDNIVEGLMERGINVTRLGQPAKVLTHTHFGCRVYAVRGLLQKSGSHTDASHHPSLHLPGHNARGGMQNALRLQPMPQIHWRILSVACTAFVVQVRENVRGASLEGKALKTEQGLKVRPVTASIGIRKCWTPLVCLYTRTAHWLDGI